mmetsp:Transcript_17385/g.45394  ORF Transcript_17385/g.45394 Transcript_17385/m.45394 type:complete len:786 (+) Transcript_17385:64-2421(+)|eukprot:CAMPEP_0182917708 /NCGR_PEP_ID=MMETSP0105_2-20130417/1666_1 /TAXON_ID=81532 ORGANISM="Acanthoeca-like sp., Strain 10tr" /NCGR_SAMPLE_ID=MMETSP0105_2 /ASSEMBLY_ACC=CAM_ASM_000205 /LENGTH=785 /DNA_ID=CAMNT_0025054723 /DNA_START=19 /DNA_END=2376 /DNA_ORIENTATION=-
MAAVAVLGMVAVGTVGSDLHFRPPAIPLFTTDPFMQTWVRGDNATADVVTHWDGQKKEMMAIVRVDGVAYRALGACAPAGTGRPAGATGAYQQGVDCGGSDLKPCGPKGCAMPDSATRIDCEAKCNATYQCEGYVWTAKGCDSQSMQHSMCWLKGGQCSITNKKCRNYRYLPSSAARTQSCPSLEAKPLSVTANPTRTIFSLGVGGKVMVNMTFLSTMFTDDYVRLSRPVYYLDFAVASLDGSPHAVSVYFDASAEHTVNAPATEAVQWGDWKASGLSGVRIGSQAQNVLGLKGDRVNINWGYLYLAATGGSTVWAGSVGKSRAAFAASGALPAAGDTRQPRMAADDLPGISTAVDLGSVLTPVHHVTMLAYDDIDSVYFFGSKYKGFWTQTYSSITDAIEVAEPEFTEMLAKSEAHDAALLANLTVAGGEKFAAVSALAYRQTLAATKLVWNHDRNVMWNFLKEISTNGDMQTMDVIFPGSPMLLYSNPNLLRLLLEPVLAYAANETYIQFTNPYSPHQLGTYPIANDTTARQEPMPLENSGNMLLMLLAILQRDPTHDASFLLPKYYPMLQSWADEMILKLPFPANQICTDDFTGPLGNNSNLGAKGMVALEAFAQICHFMPSSVGTGCDKYSNIASSYAKVWMQYADAADHYKIAYGWNSSSWSIKYNLLWQKLLKLDGPFPYDEVVTQREVPFYLKQANEYGIPMDLRHTYVKTDWLSWAAVMGNDATSFGQIWDLIFKFANETSTRVPLTDLYDTTTGAAASGGFIARPVMGGVFAKMLL